MCLFGAGLVGSFLSRLRLVSSGLGIEAIAMFTYALLQDLSKILHRCWSDSLLQCSQLACIHECVNSQVIRGRRVLAASTTLEFRNLVHV